MRTKSSTKVVKASGQKSRLDLDNGNCIRIDSGLLGVHRYPSTLASRATAKLVNITGGPFKIFPSRIVSWDRANPFSERRSRCVARRDVAVERNGEEIETIRSDRVWPLSVGRFFSWRFAVVRERNSIARKTSFFCFFKDYYFVTIIGE